jgi:hypothetical protein
MALPALKRHVTISTFGIFLAQIFGKLVQNAPSYFCVQEDNAQLLTAIALMIFAAQ